VAKSILRYGLLLALFLVVLEAAKQSHLMRATSLELYVTIVAAAFLALGIAVALRIRLFRAQRRQEQTAINPANAGEFSARERDVLLFLSHGYPNKEIAAQLGVSENTVKTHLKNIYGKLGVGNRTQAAAEAKLLKIIE